MNLYSHEHVSSFSFYFGKFSFLVLIGKRNLYFFVVK